jgi:hypothetical protein
VTESGSTFVRRQPGRRLRALPLAAGKTTIAVEESKVVVSRSTLRMGQKQNGRRMK